jgi:hypothetical protein
MSEMKAMARAYRDGEGYVTELAYKDIKLQNDRTYRVYLYPDSSPCAVDIDRRNKRGESVPGWRGLWHHRSRYRPRPSNPALEAMELAGVSPQWLTQWRFQYREDAETLAHA